DKMETRVQAIALAAFIASVFFLAGSPADGATFFVTNTNASGPGSLAAVIDDANLNPGPDTVMFESVTGIVNLSSSSQALALTDTSIVGPGARRLTIRGSGSHTTIFTSGTSSISGLRFENGVNQYGGIINNAGTLTLNEVELANGGAGFGGGAIAS